jgi:hypothetical protein
MRSTLYFLEGPIVVVNALASEFSHNQIALARQLPRLLAFTEIPSIVGTLQLDGGSTSGFSSRRLAFREQN